MISLDVTALRSLVMDAVRDALNGAADVECRGAEVTPAKFANPQPCAHCRDLRTFLLFRGESHMRCSVCLGRFGSPPSPAADEPRPVAQRTALGGVSHMQGRGRG